MAQARDTLAQIEGGCGGGGNSAVVRSACRLSAAAAIVVFAVVAKISNTGLIDVIFLVLLLVGRCLLLFAGYVPCPNFITGFLRPTINSSRGRGQIKHRPNAPKRQIISVQPRRN